MGQGFFGYNPPAFILDAARDALGRVECNQYSPTKGRPRLRKAIADAYSPFWGRQIDPETEVTITTGANEGLSRSPPPRPRRPTADGRPPPPPQGMLSAFMAFIEPGDEVIVFEPFFDQCVPLCLAGGMGGRDNQGEAEGGRGVLTGRRYISNIEMAGGKVVYVPLHPPARGAVETSSAADWTVDFDELERAMTPRTKMIVINTPRACCLPPPFFFLRLSFSGVRAGLTTWLRQTIPSARSFARTSCSASATCASRTRS